MVESAADRAALLADFGVSAVSGASSLTVLYFAPYADAGEMAGYKPSALARTADVSSAGISFGSEIMIDGAEFAVRGLEPDGLGMTTLVLEAL